MLELSEKEKIDKLIAEADKKTPPKRLFQYTSLGVLALILQNRTIRFNSLENLDDLEEASLHFCDDNPPVTYVSCWTDIIKESIPMWKLYTQMHDGVRIELPIGPFNDPRGSDGNMIGKYDYQTANWTPCIPPKQTDPDIVYMTQPYSLNYPSRIIYRNDVHVSEIIVSEEDGPNVKRVCNGRIACFKCRNCLFRKNFAIS